VWSKVYRCVECLYTPSKLPSGLRVRKRGQKDSNLRAFYRLWFSRPAHSSALPCPLIRLCGVDYTISGQNIYRRGGAQDLSFTRRKRYKARHERRLGVLSSYIQRSHNSVPSPRRSCASWTGATGLGKWPPGISDSPSRPRINGHLEDEFGLSRL
jgi:hypothetical protein